ncbi:hypothetical protein ACFST9_22925 [Hymenobacter monticola]|uniref:T9SS C-terminal target domain-containing protein n=1 Tax=Hymenobacter monticola TaxID=1705399 RepID=A0ABY4B7S5_9BACT|nr:hypothetical protein [Hymenobacter monticola]UOE34046.1 hypothetical protein MTP16_23395 [Hymenobacter monticola]
MRLLLVLLTLAAGPACAQNAPTWANVRRLRATNPDYNYGTKIAIAADGSQVVTGVFVGSITLGGQTVLSNGPGTGNLYLAKYSAAGAVLWATRLSALTRQFLHSEVAVDAAGNVYVAGAFTNSLTVGTTTLTSSSVSSTTPVDGFLIKFNAQGVQQWVRQAVAGRAGNASEAYVWGLATAANGDVVVAGSCLNSVSFGGPPLAGSGVFLYRFSAGGTLLLSKKVSDDGSLNGLALDGADNAYLVGNITGPSTFGTTRLSPSGNSDCYLCKIDPAGNQLWVRQAGGANDMSGSCVALDAAGNAIIGGSYTNVGNQGLYVGSFTAQGVPAWSQRLPVVGGVASYAVAGAVADGRGGVFVTGQAQGPTTFGSTTLNGANYYSFVARYDGQGNAVWASQPMAATASDYSTGNGLATDAAGNVYVTGQVSGTAQFGALLVTTGRSETFIAQLTAGGVLTARTAAARLPLPAFPNPATGSCTLVLPAGGGHLAVRDALGRTVRELMLSATGPSPVDLTGLAPGLYQLQATLANGQLVYGALQVQ